MEVSGVFKLMDMGGTLGKDVPVTLVTFQWDKRVKVFRFHQTIAFFCIFCYILITLPV